MTEQIVKFETAKILKEKGWNIPSRGFIDPITKNPFEFIDDKVLYVYKGYENIEEWYEILENDFLLGSTQTQVTDWLRNIHKVHIRIDCNDGDWYFFLQSTENKYFKSQCEQNYNSYEDCLEEGILYALNLI